MMNFLNWTCFIFICVFEIVSSQHLGCYRTDKDTDQKWKLVFVDNFEATSNLSKWTRTNECAQFVNCNSQANVHLHDGFLVLSTRGPHADASLNYSGSKLYLGGHPLRPPFQIEVRVINPVGDSPTVGANIDAFYTGMGPVDVRLLLDASQLIEANRLYRGLLTFNHYSLDQQSNDKFSGLHRYTATWGLEEITFSIDGGATYRVPNNSTTIPHQPDLLLFQMGAGVVANRKVPSMTPGNYTIFSPSWSCPALLVDYVRVWAPITQADVTAEGALECILPHERRGGSGDEMATIRKLCQMYGGNGDWSGKKKPNWAAYVVLIVILIFFISLTGFFCYKYKH